MATDIQKKNIKPPANRSAAKTNLSDRLKWGLIFLILIGAIIANYSMRDLAWGLQAAAGIILVVVVVAIALLTRQGRTAWEFVKASRGELHKVTWPTRAETTQTTLAVIAMVVVTAIILWGFDTLFFWAISWVTVAGAH